MRKLLLPALALIALLAPGQAVGRTWVVWADAPSNPPADLATSYLFLDQFFPKTLQIRVGDKVTVRSRQFHTATFLGSKSIAQMPLLMPDPAAHYTGILDAAGAPFWFNGGPPKFIYNPEAFQVVGTPTVADRSVHSSGNFVFSQTHRYTFTFPKRGTYKLICLVHPTMQGAIVVKAKKAKIPTTTRVAATTLKQLAASWATARSLVSHVPSDPRTVIAGLGKDTAVLGFQPKRLTVPVGATVTWDNDSPSEPHNMAFGDEAYLTRLGETLDLFPVAPGAPNQVLPFVVFGSDPPGPYVHTGSNHGNGFLATPVIDLNPNTPNPETFGVKFTKAGTYHYLCQIHGKDMSGDVVVTG